MSAGPVHERPGSHDRGRLPGLEPRVPDQVTRMREFLDKYPEVMIFLPENTPRGKYYEAKWGPHGHFASPDLRSLLDALEAVFPGDGA